jgi:hypothetical protein
VGGALEDVRGLGQVGRRIGVVMGVDPMQRHFPVLADFLA